MRRAAIHILLVTGLIAFAGCESLRIGSALSVTDSSWVQEGGGADRARLADTPTPPLVERWHYNAGAGFGFASPLVVGDRLILVTRSGEIHVINPTDGDKIGNVSIGDAIEGTPVLVSPRVVVVPVYGGKFGLLAYDLVDGSRDWEIEGAHHEAGLLLVGEDVIAADVHGVVRSLNGLTGHLNWEHDLGSTGGFAASPVQLSDGSVLLGSVEGGIYLLNPVSGEMVSERMLEDPVLRTPAVHGDIAYVPTSRGRFYALNPEGGERWVLDTGNQNIRFASPATDGSRVIVGGTDGIVRSLDTETGEIQWEQRFDGNVSAAPLLSDHHVFVGTYDRTFAALDAATGQVVWEEELGGRIKSPAVAVNGIVVVLSEPKDVIGFSSEQVVER